MLPKINPTQTSSWKKLEEKWKNNRTKHLQDFFKEDDNRVEKFHQTGAGILLDYSKNHLDDDTFRLLIDLANDCQLKDAISAFKKATKINEKEGRAVLHFALRSPEKEIILDNQNVKKLVDDELQKIKTIAEKIYKGTWEGATGKKIKHIVNIGIGGSDLGPQMVCNALQPYWKEITPHFLSNVDAAHWEIIQKKINPEETIFIVASKTFTTDETMTNAHTVRSWFLDKMGDESALEKHFFAVSTNLEAVQNFGIPSQNVVGFWDWVGGRFSLWSSIGLSIACTIGYENFALLLKGASQMDDHFFETEWDKNLPVIMALTKIFHVNFMNLKQHAVLPYDQRLQDFPRFLQQLIMESNGKQIDRLGNRVPYATCPIYFGEPGTNGQHAFYQLLHQGTEIVPADFILFKKPHHDHPIHHKKLIANCIAQSEALMEGFYHPDSFKNFEGNRPSNTLILEKLCPENLGALIALYEHQVFVQGVLWNIFSFDQWGVELGKKLALNILNAEEKSQNPSTLFLLKQTMDAS